MSVSIHHSCLALYVKIWSGILGSHKGEFYGEAALENGMTELYRAWNLL
uniref:Uncharacterized protein n=1 Tax=Anguilla anguilla TaxID=7936 RepID=A0A0E9WDS0_ANGAN